MVILISGDCGSERLFWGSDDKVPLGGGCWSLAAEDLNEGLLTVLVASFQSGPTVDGTGSSRSDCGWEFWLLVADGVATESLTDLESAAPAA